MLRARGSAWAWIQVGFSDYAGDWFTTISSFEFGYEVRARIDPRHIGRLTLTRDCFTSRLLCTDQSSSYCPPPTCIAPTIATRVHDYCAIYDAPPDPPFVFHTPYDTSNCNIV